MNRFAKLHQVLTALEVARAIHLHLARVKTGPGLIWRCRVEILMCLSDSLSLSPTAIRLMRSCGAAVRVEEKGSGHFPTNQLLLNQKTRQNSKKLACHSFLLLSEGLLGRRALLRIQRGKKEHKPLLQNRLPPPPRVG